MKREDFNFHKRIGTHSQRRHAQDKIVNPAGVGRWNVVGETGEHHVSILESGLSCDCDWAAAHGICSHIIAVMLYKKMPLEERFYGKVNL